MPSTRSRPSRFPSATPANSRASSPLTPPPPGADIPLADQPLDDPNAPLVDQPVNNPNVPLVDPTSATSAATAADIITSILPDRPRTPAARVDLSPSGAGGTSASQGEGRRGEGMRGSPVTPSKTQYPARNKKALRAAYGEKRSFKLAPRPCFRCDLPCYVQVAGKKRRCYSCATGPCSFQPSLSSPVASSNAPYVDPLAARYHRMSGRLHSLLPLFEDGTVGMAIMHDVMDEFQRLGDDMGMNGQGPSGTSALVGDTPRTRRRNAVASSSRRRVEVEESEAESIAMDSEGEGGGGGEDEEDELVSEDEFLPAGDN